MERIRFGILESLRMWLVAVRLSSGLAISGAEAAERVSG
jgi:hypothetical protein